MATESESNGASKETNSKSRVSDKELVEALKVEWKLMWSERFNDKTKAEGVSVATIALYKLIEARLSMQPGTLRP